MSPAGSMQRSTVETEMSERHTKVPRHVTFAESPAEQRGEKRSDAEGGHIDEDVVIIHEHPTQSGSWKMIEMQTLVTDSRVFS